MARPVGLSLTVVSAVRTLTGSPVAVDSTSLVDANFSPTPDNTNGGALNAFGFASVVFGVEFTGGAGPTIGLELLFRDDNAADGSRWKRLSPNTIVTLDGTGLVEMSTYGRLVFPRLNAVTGNPTGVTLLAFPGNRMPGRAYY